MEQWQPPSAKKKARLNPIAERAESVLGEYKTRAEQRLEDIDTIESDARQLQEELSTK